MKCAEVEAWAGRGRPREIKRLDSEPSGRLAVRHSVVYATGAQDFQDTHGRWRADVADPGVYVGPAFHFGWDAVLTPEASLLSFDAAGLTHARDAARLRADGYDDVKIQLTRRAASRDGWASATSWSRRTPPSSSTRRAGRGPDGCPATTVAAVRCRRSSGRWRYRRSPRGEAPGARSIGNA